MIEDEEFIDPSTEGLLLSLEKKETETRLELFFSERSETDIDRLLEASRRAIGALYSLFPWASSGLRSISVPLNLETCGADNERQRVLRNFEEGRIEHYRTVSVHPSTSLPRGVIDRLPILNAHFPYPLGLYKIRRGRQPEVSLSSF